MPDPFEMRIELGKVREFARATGSQRPEQTDGDNPVTPVTFLQAAAFWQTATSSPWPPDRDLTRALHASQEFVFPNGPPQAGAVLTGLSRIEDRWTKQGKRGGQLDFTLVVTDYTDESGELVAQVRNTSVSTSKPTGAS